MSLPDIKKYKRQRPEKGEKKEVAPGVVMIGGLGAPSSYISKAIDVLEAGIEGKDGGSKKLTLLGGGNAVGKAVTVAEVVKRRIKGLHQISTLTSETVTDTFVPRKEGGGDPVTVERVVPGIKIELSLDPLDDKAMGYQAPIDESLVKPEDKSKRGTQGRGRGKGRKGGKGRGKGGRGKSSEWSWLPFTRGGPRSRGGALPSRGKGRPSRSRGGGFGGMGVRSRGGGGKGIRSRGGGKGYGGRRSTSRGGGGGFQVQRSRGAGSRPYYSGGGGYRPPSRPAPVRSRGGGGGYSGLPRSRGAGGYGGPPRSRGGGYGGPPRSRGAGFRQYVY